MVLRALRWSFRRLMSIYFRRIETVGEAPGPATRGRVFVSNHVNALVDPILVITTAPCDISPIAKSTLWGIPGLRWLLDVARAVPIVRRRDNPSKSAADNDAVFDRIAAWLAGGGNILIFPEGTSHNEPYVLPAKTGAARMLARAKEHGARELTYQAVALEFDERDVFRSRCLLVYGPVRALDAESGEGEALVRAVTERIHADLSELLVEGTTWDERLRIARVAEMFAHDEGDASLARWNTLGRQVEAARKTMSGLDAASIERIGGAVDRYYALLTREGVGDEQIASPSAAGPTGAAIAFFRALVLWACLPLALAGIVLYALPYQVPRLAARPATRSADEISTYKLGAGLVVYPLWAAGLVALSFRLLPVGAAALATLVALLSPAAALAWLDALPRLGRSIRAVTRAARLAELRRAREEAMTLVRETRERWAL